MDKVTITRPWWEISDMGRIIPDSPPLKFLLSHTMMAGYRYLSTSRESKVCQPTKLVPSKAPIKSKNTVANKKAVVLTFPDVVISPEKLIAEGDLVTIYWIARGTNTGAGNGLPATGKKAELAGITIWRIVDGKIKEEWSAFDQLSMMQQLGLLPANK